MSHTLLKVHELFIYFYGFYNTLMQELFSLSMNKLWVVLREQEKMLFQKDCWPN